MTFTLEAVQHNAAARNWGHLIRADDNPTPCARCNATAVVTGDSTGRRVCVACGTHDSNTQHNGD